MAYAFNDDKSKFDLDETLDNVDNIAGSLATIEVSPVITNHETGEYIMYDNMLFKVTNPIATGEDLVLGTNVSPVNIGDQLKSLQDFMSKVVIEGHATKFGVSKNTTSSSMYTDYNVSSDDLGISTFRIWRDGRVQFNDNGNWIPLRFAN